MDFRRRKCVIFSMPIISCMADEEFGVVANFGAGQPEYEHGMVMKLGHNGERQPKRADARQQPLLDTSLIQRRVIISTFCSSIKDTPRSAREQAFSDANHFFRVLREFSSDFFTYYYY